MGENERAGVKAPVLFVGGSASARRRAATVQHWLALHPERCRLCHRGGKDAFKRLGDDVFGDHGPAAPYLGHGCGLALGGMGALDCD